LLLALGGETPWKVFLEDPGLKHLAHLCLAGIETLFSTKGLAALGTYVIIHLFLGFRFYRRFLKQVDRVVDKRVLALQLELRAAFEKQLDTVLEALEATSNDIAKEKSKISAMTESRP
jgi:hypothetical protein